ncbi:hypothetical protein TNCV_1292451 [Trichonephila clavipes]|nr:hypothetical protein TNCV_1292451 [Trichonephila clavipes]
MSSSLVTLKTRRAEGDRCTLNMSNLKRPPTGVEVRRGDAGSQVEETHTISKIPEMSNTLNVNKVSKAHLEPKEQEVELQAVKNHCEELLDFSTELKENIDRMLEKAKENMQQYKKRLKQVTDHMKLCVMASPNCEVHCI